jgi:hypothetical protein
MNVTDRVRAARCSPAFIGKGLNFKVYVGNPASDIGRNSRIFVPIICLKSLSISVTILSS